jgi:hypothetical protein
MEKSPTDWLTPLDRLVL